MVEAALKEWVDAITDCEAFVDSLTGKEYYQAQQLENPVEYNVYFPYREDVKTTCGSFGKTEMTGFWSFSPRLSIKAAKVKSCALNAVQGRTFADEQDYKADDEGC